MWEYHDDLPAEGTWPGGQRFGYEVRRELRPRDWTMEEERRAYERDVELPAADLLVVESWRDQPMPSMLVPAGSGGGWRVVDARIARTYARSWWLTTVEDLPRFRIRRLMLGPIVGGWLVVGVRRTYGSFLWRGRAERWVAKHRECVRCDECRVGLSS